MPAGGSTGAEGGQRVAAVSQRWENACARWGLGRGRGRVLVKALAQKIGELYVDGARIAQAACGVVHGRGSIG